MTVDLDAGGRELVEAEDDLPAARRDRAVDVAGRRVVGGDEEAVAGAAAPAAEALARRPGGDARVEAAEVDDAVRGLGVGERDVDAASCPAGTSKGR